MDEVAAHIGDEYIPAILGGPRVAAIDGHAGGAGEIARSTAAALDGAGHQTLYPQARAHFAPPLHRARAKHFCRRAIRRDALSRRGWREVGIARSVAVFVPHPLEMVAVGADEVAAKVVEGLAMLCAAALCAEVACARVEGEVTSAHRHGCHVGLVGPGDIAA